jgi:hypothetical protein
VSAPDATEIRTFIARRWREQRHDRGARAVGDPRVQGYGEDLCDALLSAACADVQHVAEAMLLEAMTTALARFAAEHPDAPRSRHDPDIAATS